MERNLFKYIWRHSKREQIVVLVIVLASLPFYFVSLSLPAAIVNGPIEGTWFQEGVSRPFLEIYLPFSEWFGERIRLFEGFQLTRVEMLLALSFSYLGLVFINGQFKFQVNTLKGRMGERMLRRVRFELVDRVLRFPPSYFRKLKPAEVASMVKDEVEPLGGFIGDAFVLPMFQGGIALTALVFIMVQNVWLGAVAGAVVLFQAFIIPVLRRPILKLSKERQIAAREMAGRVGELVDGVDEVRINATSNYERADISNRLGRLFSIRYEIFRRKFFVKFLNNFLGKFTPFIFYAAGGYFVIIGQLDIGQLIAVIAAYPDLPAPVKMMIDWDQQRLDVQIKYDQVVDHFDPDDMVPAEAQQPVGEVSHLQGGIVATNVTVMDDTGARLLQNISFTVGLGETLAIVGPAAGGKEHIGPTLVRLFPPSAGHLVLGGRDLSSLPEGVIGRWVGYSGQDTYLFPVSLRENLTYGLKHEPLTPPDESPRDQERRAWTAAETRRAGNAEYDLDAEWIDYHSIGVAGAAELRKRMLDVLRHVGLQDDVYEMGLAGYISPDTHPELCTKFMYARRVFGDLIKKRGLAHLVESFHPDKYNRNASLGENLLFGRPCGPFLGEGALVSHPYFQETLHKAQIADAMVTMGYEIATTMVELFAGLPADHPFFDQFSFISALDLPDYKGLVNRYSSNISWESVDDDDRVKLLTLALRYEDARHRLGLITPDIAAQVVLARKTFRRNLPDALQDAVRLYDPENYNAASSILDNLLFGRIAYGEAKARDRVLELLSELLGELELHEAVYDAGLDFNVGPGGKRLATPTRQRLGLARAILKRPDILVIDAALAVLDTPTQEKILQSVLASSGSRAVIWVLGRPEQAVLFDRVLVIDGGRVVEEGKAQDLLARNGPYAALANHKPRQAAE